MFRVINPNNIYSFSQRAKILISNSNSIYFNLAFEEYLFESSNYSLIQPISTVLHSSSIGIVPPSSSADTKTLGKSVETSWWEMMESLCREGRQEEEQFIKTLATVVSVFWHLMNKAVTTTIKLSTMLF